MAPRWGLNEGRKEVIATSGADATRNPTEVIPSLRGRKFICCGGPCMDDPLVPGVEMVSAHPDKDEHEDHSQ